MNKIKKNQIVVFLFLLMICVGCSYSHRPEIEIDATKNIELTYEGLDGNIVAYVENHIEYDKTDEPVVKLIESFKYDISPNEYLSTGDTIKVKVQYNDQLAKIANVKIINIEKEFLVNKTYTYEGKIVKDGIEYLIYDGYEIPAHWDMTEKELLEWLDYKKYLDENPNDEDLGEEVQLWNSGLSETITNRQNTKFFASDFNGDLIKAEYEATSFGKTSSQEYRIDFIYDKETYKLIGYETVFKEE